MNIFGNELIIRGCKVLIIFCSWLFSLVNNIRCVTLIKTMILMIMVYYWFLVSLLLMLFLDRFLSNKLIDDSSGCVMMRIKFIMFLWLSFRVNHFLLIS